MYFAMPETEGRTLEEVEMYFSDRHRSMFDRHVPRMRDLGNTHKRTVSPTGVENIALEA